MIREGRADRALGGGMRLDVMLGWHGIDRKPIEVS